MLLGEVLSCIRDSVTMNRIMIIGPPGAGKTTLARELGDILDIEVIHLDRYFWHEGWEKAKSVSMSKWEKQQHAFMSRDSWIIDGSYHDTLDSRVSGADIIIFLDMPRLLCIWRVIKRHFSQSLRPDLPHNIVDKLDWKFIEKIWNFRRNERRIILGIIRSQEIADKVIWLHSRREVAQFLRSVLEGTGVL